MSFYSVRAPRSRSTPGQPRILAPLFSHSDHLTRCASTQTSPLTASAYLCDTYFLLLSLFPSRTPPAHISTQSHPFSFPSSTNHLHRLQARPGGYRVQCLHNTHMHTPLRRDNRGTSRNPEKRYFPIPPSTPPYSFFFAAGSSSHSDDDTSSVPGRPLISYRVAPLIGCAHPIRIKRHPISRPYRVASLIVCAHVGRWAAAEGWRGGGHPILMFFARPGEPGWQGWPQ